jgi:hypothetical protein
MNPRVLWGALAATLAASAWAVWDAGRGGYSELLAAPAAVSRAVAPVPAAEVLPAPAALPDRSAVPAPRRDLFAAPVQRVPATVAPAPPPPLPRPVLPWTFGGRYATPSGAAVLLNEGGRTHVLQPGAVQGEFRLEADLGQRLEFTHLPTGERLVLPVQP